MSSLLRRQGVYNRQKQTASKVSATVNKLVRSSFLGRDPSGERLIPDDMWDDDDDLTEQDTFL